jgi:SHAQKYF class myb-like DNA-binding protein
MVPASVSSEHQHQYAVQQAHHEQQHHGALEQQHSLPEEEEDDNESDDPQESASGRSSRRKRRGSDSSGTATKGKGRKKAKTTDPRWSKRFTWPEDLHRDFVSAIFDVGLKHSSPSTILEHMPKHDHITTERIKSHLQKYRMHRIKSKQEFISSYESSVRKFQQHGPNGVKKIACGEVAAHLTHCALNESSTKAPSLAAAIPNPAPEPAASAPKEAQVFHAPEKHSEALVLPQLTEAEKQSPMGSAMGYLMGLFFSLKQQLMIQRAKEAGPDDNMLGKSPVQDVFNSFVAGSAPAVSVPSAGAEYILDPSLLQQQSFEGTPHKNSMNPLSNPPVLSVPSVRTNIQENSMMKREMQNQMALQNKMRALKQQELNKYKDVNNSQQQVNEEGKEKQSNPPVSQSPIPEEEAKVAEAASRVHQGAGETAGNDGSSGDHRQRQRGISIGDSEEFWNTDVVDEQLFEFLMNN